jgi:hypothetical protein
MNAYPNQISNPYPARDPDSLPRQPVTLEAISLIEQTMAEVLGTLRRQANGSAERDAAALEYASWQRSRH